MLVYHWDSIFFCLLEMKDGAEGIISRLIEQGSYDSAYHYIDGWAYDYTGVQQFLRATGTFFLPYTMVQELPARSEETNVRLPLLLSLPVISCAWQ